MSAELQKMLHFPWAPQNLLKGAKVPTSTYLALTGHKLSYNMAQEFTGKEERGRVGSLMQQQKGTYITVLQADKWVTAGQGN